MSKQAMVWGCALLLLLGMAICNPLGAQQADNPFGGRPIRRAAQSVAPEERIDAILNQRLKTPLEYEQEQLDVVLAALADEYNIPLVFDKAALDEVAISPEAEVSVSLRQISLRSALKIMFREPGLEDLTYVIEDEVLLITTEEKANETLITRVYRVDEFSSSMANPLEGMMGASAWADYNPLIGMITSCVEPKSWKDNGTGDGDINLVHPGMLVILQTRHVHEQIENLFTKLRATRKQVITEAKAKLSATRPMTRGFVINVAVGDEAKEFKERLASAIKKSVDWSSSDSTAQDAWIEVLPGRILVRHTPKVLAQVEAALHQMKLLAPVAIGGTGGGGIGTRRTGGGSGGAF